MNARLSCLASAALASLTLALPTQAAPTFVNGLAISGSTGDQFGASVNDGRLGMFSDLYYDRSRNEWWGLSDRGPGGGTLSYDTRVQRFSLDVNASTGAISNFRVQQTVKFSNANGFYNGLAPNPTNVLGNALDPEGFVINPRNGHLLVSDEYGPSLYEFDRSGMLVKAFNTPANLVPRSAANVPNYASDAGNTLGKRTNRGFEGLAISPDGQFAYAQLQSATLGEGGGNGNSSRIVKFDTATGNAVAQYAYFQQGSSQGRGTSALVALGDERFLVIERNNRGVGVPNADLAGPLKSVYQIDLSGATDVSGVVLPNAVTGLPPGVKPVTKGAAPFIDLAANTLPALGLSPEKWEGLAVGPKLADGSYLLLAGTDNDYSVTQNGSNVQFDVYFNPTTQARVQCDLGGTTNCFAISSSGSVGPTNLGNLPSGYALIPGVLHAYKVSAADLGGYIAPVPEPETCALMLAGLGIVGWMSKRKTKSANSTAA